MSSDTKAKALGKLRTAGVRLDSVSDDELKALRAACTQLLKLDEDDRRRVVKAAEELG